MTGILCWVFLIFAAFQQDGFATSTESTTSSMMMTSSLMTSDGARENATASDDEFRCRGGHVISGTKVCDSLEGDCPGGDDEGAFCGRGSERCWAWQATSCNSTSGTCNRGYFQCDNGKCIPFRWACNRHNDCGDQSDEQRSIPGMKCVFGSRIDVCVLPQRYVEDGFAHCSDGTDEDCPDRCFSCFDQRLMIKNEQVCDGVFDCYDLTDECLCENYTGTVPPLCDTICVGERRGCAANTFPDCDGRRHGRVDSICDGRVDCARGEDEEFCRKFASRDVTACPGGGRSEARHLAAYVCDGRPECRDLADECGAGCEREADFCRLRPMLDRDLSYRCPDSGYVLTAADLCDGRWSPCEPRVQFEERNCTSRFYCDSAANSDFISVDAALRCDGQRDCDDASDESGCEDRFYCVGGSPLSVPKRFMFDDFLDCDDGSDECPPSLDDDLFSSRNELIRESVLRAWLWIVAALAIVGNAYVIAKTARSMRKRKRRSWVARSNRFLIFNLAISDLLTGVYLVVLAAHSASFSGRFCYVIRRWQTGAVCQLLGALLVASSEASVFILSILTAVRAYAVARPWLRVHSIAPVVAVTGCAWALAIAISVFPLVGSMNDVFVGSAWLPSKFFRATRVTQTAAVRFTDRISAFSANLTPLAASKGASVPWPDIRAYLAGNRPEHAVRGLFGYYSGNSVCVSRVFVTTADRGWQFSVAVVTINLVLFIYIALTYFVLYRLSTREKLQRSGSEMKRALRMQHKIFNLVATDFACWVPVCVMSYLHLAEVVNLAGVAYVVVAVVLLPVNSVLNPLLYSRTFERVWYRSKRASTRFFSRLSRRKAVRAKTRDVNVVEPPTGDMTLT